MAAFESLEERRVLLELDFSVHVRDVAAQPFVFHETAGRIGHVPDFYVERADGNALVIDVKPLHLRSDPSTARLLEQMASACVDAGWRYELREAPRGTRLRNLEWLACNRREPPLFDRYAPQLLQACSDPRPLDALAQEIGPDALVRPTLFHLLWTQRLRVDLDEPLSNKSQIRRPKEGPATSGTAR